MKDTLPSSPHFAHTLDRFATLCLEMAEAVNEVTQADREAVAVVKRWLPTKQTKFASLAEATQYGHAIDAVTEATAGVTPRLKTLTDCFDKLSRAVRRIVALGERIKAGWPVPRGISDTRRAMLLRQAVNGTRKTIRTHTNADEDATERLFADLNTHLDDPAFEQTLLERPVHEMVNLLCQALGLKPLPKDTAPAGRRHDPG